MGKLRTVPKYQSFLSQEEYDAYLKVLQDAQKAAESNHVFYDLEEDEKPSKVKKALNYVARKLNLEVTIRQVRGSRSLALTFRKGRAPSQGRMSAEESRNRILKCLRSHGGPMKKNEILRQTGVSPSTWNIRIKELIAEGLIVRHGERRDTTYEGVK
jgi:Fic family protein